MSVVRHVNFRLVSCFRNFYAFTALHDSLSDRHDSEAAMAGLGAVAIVLGKGER